MKTFAKRIVGQTAASLGINRRRHGQRALILMLHRVLSAHDFGHLRFQRSLAMSQDGLDQLLQFLQKHYTLIQVEDYLALPQTHRHKERFACLTFDDGWADNFSHAWPVLSSHRCPASIYLSTGFIGAQRHFWWQTWGDALVAQSPSQFAETRRQLIDIAPALATTDSVDTLIEAGKTLDETLREAVTRFLTATTETPPAHALSWEQVETLSASGLIRFGTHTVNHGLLPQLDTASARYEIRQCAQDVQAHPRVAFNRIFCYPNGDRDAATETLVKEAGYIAALGTQRGFASREAAERFHLPRVNVTEAQVRDKALFQYRLLKAAAAREAWA